MTQSIEILKFETDHGLGTRARLGLIVLQTDQTIENDFARIFCNENDISLHVARIPNAMEVSPETLRQMSIDLPRAAELLPSQFGFDVVGYGCTSGATSVSYTHLTLPTKA